MDQATAKALLEKYNRGTASPEEKTIIESWYLYHANISSPAARAVDYQQKRQEMLESIIAAYPEKKRNVLLWPHRIVAAAAAIVIVLGIWLYRNASTLTSQPRNAAAYKNDIAPGKNMATLAFNGKIINLDTNQNSVVIADSLGTTNLEELLTASTPRGGTYQFTLPDGTNVWLNADSKLEFAANFRKGKQRMVKLRGEGYFEVAKDKYHPFIVETGGQQVEVLGTHFNISSYANEKAIKTTLLEGSIKISGNGLDEVLKPGQQAKLSKGRLAVVKDVDLEEVMAWKIGYFKFNEDLERIMEKVARWYDVEIIYDPELNRQMQFEGKISRARNISALLEIMESTGNVHFKIEGRRVRVMP